MSAYRDRCDSAQEDAEKYLANHVMVEEPVRAFRFHLHYVDKKYDKGVTTVRPGFLTFEPKQSARFAYNSTYAFTLTWTPGHMTIVGDLGELTVVHYGAMPTLNEACHWLLSPDYHYLLSKTKEQRQFDRDATIEDIWRCLTEEVAEGQKAYAEELAYWQDEKPKWLKREGMTKREFDADMKRWEEDHPRFRYGFSEARRPHYTINRNLWSKEEEFGWRVPDGYWHLAKLWKFLRDESECFESDPNFLLTDEGLQNIKKCFERWASDRNEGELIAMMYRDIGYDDYSGIYEYRPQAFFQIAAIQHGCRMILEKYASREKEAA